MILVRLEKKNDIDWKRFFETLDETGCRGVVSVEAKDHDFKESLESRQEALRKSILFLRPFIQ